MRPNKVNKINKLLIILLLFICGICINRDRVMALYNGKGGIGFSIGNAGSCGTSANCAKGNQDYIIVSLLIVYTGESIDGIGEIQAEPVYFANKAAFDRLKGSGINIKHFEPFDGIDLKATPYNYEAAYNELKKYFGDIRNEVTQSMEDFLNESLGNYKEKLTKNSEWADPDKAAKVGYRIFLQPATLYVNPTVGKYKNNKAALITPKEFAEIMVLSRGTEKPSCVNSSSGCLNPLLGKKSQAQYFMVEFDDVGISGVDKNYCESLPYQELASWDDGCGLNILDISLYANTPKCYKVDIKKDNPVCNNNDRNNKGEYKEEYTKISCDGATSEQETNTEYGKLMNELNENCNIYCIESATASFPGGISSRMALEIVPHEGTYFAWPTMRSDSNSYTLSMTSKFTCRIVKKGNNSCDTTSLINNVKSRIESNDMQFGAQLTAGTNNKIDAESLIKDGNSEYNYSTNLKFNANGISDPLIFERKQYLKIKNDTNRYYDRENDKATSFPYYTFFDRKQGVVSLKRTDDTNNDYKLILTNIKLGLNNIFGSEDAYNYTCSYSISNNSCLCPENSPKAGFDIYSGYKYVGLTEEDLKNKTCLDLQNEFCYEKPAYYCYSETGKIDITQCVNKKIIDEGMSWDDARKKCTDEQPECQDYCIIPETGEIKDITKCLEDNDNNRTFCENTYCRSNVPCEDCCYDEGNNCEWVEEPITSSNFKKYTELKKFSFEYKDVNALKIIKAYRKDCKVDDTIYKDCEHKAFVCPDGIDGMKDPTNCFSTELSKYGYSSITDMLKEKKEYLVNKIFATCQEQVCPNGKNKKILYRVIDLNNPFPGKNGNGRKPGSNWNSTTVIENKIKKARGANGYDLYKKEPLYKITLTPDTIKEIRKYNKENDYSDFTLNCTNNNRSKCISEFIHKEIADNVEGKCKTMTDSTEFDNCYNGN